MKRAGSTLYFALLAIFVQSILLFLTGETIKLETIGLSYTYMVFVFVLYFFAIDVEQKRMWFSEELRSYALRKQTSNRLAFAFFISLIMLPMNSIIFSMEVSRLAFMQIASVLISAAIFDVARKAINRYTYKVSLCENKKTTKEVTGNGSRYTESAVCLCR